MPRSRPERLGSVVQRRDVEARRIGEEDHHEGRLQQEDQELCVGRQLDDAEHGPGHETDGGKEDGRRDDRRCQPLREEGVRQQRKRDEDQGVDHLAVPPLPRVPSPAPPARASWAAYQWTSSEGARSCRRSCDIIRSGWSTWWKKALYPAHR